MREGVGGRELDKGREVWREGGVREVRERDR